MTTQWVTQEVEWLNPKTGLYETMTELSRVEDRARARKSMEAALAFASGRSAEYRNAEAKATEKPKADAPARANMRRLFREEPTGMAANSNGATRTAAEAMRATLRRHGVTPKGEGA